jgi:hypothetical protein
MKKIMAFQGIALAKIGKRQAVRWIDSKNTDGRQFWFPFLPERIDKTCCHTEKTKKRAAVIPQPFTTGR